MKSIPKYKLLADTLKKEVLSEKYAHLDKFPTEHQLAEQYKLCRQSVRQAISLLENEELLTSRRGSGTYVNKPRAVPVKTMRIGVISTYITEYIFPSIVRGIESVLTQNGYSLILTATHNRVDNERKLLQDFIEKKVDGLIVEGTKTTLPNPNLALYREIQRMGIPIVFINAYYPELKDSVFVVMDDFSGGLQAAQYLTSQGHSRIAGIFKSDDMQGHRRYAGFTKGLLDAKIPVTDDAVVWYTTQSAGLFAEPDDALLKTLEDSTAVVCYNDLIAVQLLDVLRRLGKRVPEDMTVVSFDNSHYSSLGIVRIVSLNHPKEELGQRAAQKLLSMIQGGKEEPEILPWTLVSE